MKGRYIMEFDLELVATLMYEEKVTWSLDEEKGIAIMVPRDSRYPYEMYSFKQYLKAKDVVYGMKLREERLK